MNVLSLFHTKQTTNHLIYKIGSNVMNTQIDLLNLCGVLGFEAIQNMFDANMINREQLEHVSYMWKQVNKKTYKITVRSFNDGNSEFEEIVYIDPCDVMEVNYQHTQGGEQSLESVIINQDKYIAEKMLSALNSVLKMRQQFNMSCSSIKCAILLLNNQVINK